MKTINLKLLALAFMATTAVPVIAQEEHAHDAHQAEVTAEASQMTMATIRKLDPDKGKITLKHEAIKNLKMPGMTMVFQIEDKALFSGLSEGDMVQFKAEKKGTALVVTSLEKMQHKGH